ncbi:erythromycin esterase [Kordia sp. SMS9]|uniref:erythromycin esterase family protein n=1 Tax=Kordia sp. SMS9 TaxID=2282170 RepID=UPI000E0D31AB|nr:erythromycin esterase family protein [Kordia sp. SMS9]AXG69782.1 erythromycin esterase [Kordia sp. SMS9]
MKIATILIAICFSLCANGQSLSQEINKTKTLLHFDTPETLDASLDALVAQIGDKRIVALGEDTHGTKEFYELRAAITKKLIQEKGFNLVILENPYEDLEALSQNLQTQPIDSLIKTHLFSIYQTESMKNFLQWLQTYNQTHTPIVFKGCDDSYRELLPEMISIELKSNITPEMTNILKEFHERVTVEASDFYVKYPDKKPVKIDNYGYYREVYRLILQLEKEIKKENSSSKYLDELLLNAKNSYINYEMIYTGKIITRDIVMAERVAFFAKDPKAKIIVWAHNAHISKEVIIDNEIGLMGRNLKQEFPNEYVAIAMSSFSGSYSHIKKRLINDDHDYGDQLYEANYPTPPANTFEEKLGQNTSEAYYFHINQNIQKSCAQLPKQKLKLFGYGMNDEKDYYEVNPALMYDYVVFVKKTNATKPLFNYEQKK